MDFSLIRDALMVFFGILIEAVPFVLIGVLASNGLRVYVPDEALLRWLPSNRLLGPFAGSALGFVFPVCECGNIPVARTMFLKKVPPHVVISFLLAAPVFNPIVIFATLAAFRDQPEILFLRLGFSLGIAITIGLLFSFSKSPQDYLNTKLAQLCETRPDSQPTNAQQGKTNRFVQASIHEFFEMCGVLVLGAFIASFSQIVVPREVVTGIGDGPVSSVAAMMMLAMIVSICSNVDSFFALSYTNTFTQPSILAFLVFGPMIDIKALIMLKTVFKVRTILWIALMSASLTFLITVFMNLNIS